MSRTKLRTEWLTYWFLVAAAVIAVCLPGRSNLAEVKLTPAYPVASRTAAELQPRSTSDAAVDSRTTNSTATGLELTLELIGPLLSDESSPVATTADEASSDVPLVTAAAPKKPATTGEDATGDAQADTDAAPSPGSSSTELTPELTALRDKVRGVLAMYFPRHQNARDNNAWEIMHAIIAYGVDTQIFKDRPGGERTSAIGWLCFNYPCAGDRMLFVHNDKLEARRGVGVQGHHGQFLAILAQSRLTSDYPMYVSGKHFTLADLIEHEKQTCVAGEELTFKLIALMHYLDSDETWKSRDGQEWSIQRLIREELAQPIRGAACGGSHRLMGFSYAVNKRLQRGKPIVGEFQRAQTFINDYHRYTLGLQNPDGSFSTEWFVRKGNNPDIDRRLKTSGHILEWITFSLPQQDLRDPRIVKAVDYVAALLQSHDKHVWEIGPLGHGLHALAQYDARVFKPADSPQAQAIVRTAPDGEGPTIEARRETQPSK